MTHLTVGGPNDISGMAEARVVKFCHIFTADTSNLVYRLDIASPNYR